MRKILLVFVLLLFAPAIAYPQELFVSYLKPIVQKESKAIFSKRDPTAEPYILLRTVTGEKAAASGFDLKAILYNPEDKKAFIGDNLYKEGGAVNGYIIKSIFPKKVILVKGNKETVLKFEEGDKQ